MDFDFFKDNEDSIVFIEKYGRNLTDLAKENKLEPVIGRDEEIRRLIRILSRKTKNNPILVGDPGVGKTAIVEALAKRIVVGDVPDNLKNKQIVEIDVPLLFAGASFQGEFEKRIKKLTAEIVAKEGEILIFIDEIHLIVGTGKNSQGSSMDMANILKPMLARGELHLIGATTFEEYKRFIESDSALERRMQKIRVDEPSIQSTITILRGIKERFENFHRVKISDEAIIQAVNLSSRFISDRFLPDKAIDLIDEAAATIKTILNSKPEEYDKLMQEKANLEMEKIAISKEEKSSKIQSRIKEISLQLEDINKKMKLIFDKWNEEKKSFNDVAKLKSNLEIYRYKLNKSQNDSDFAKASELMYKIIPDLEEKIRDSEKKLVSNDKNSFLKFKVQASDISEIVSKWTQIPVSKLLSSDIDKILILEKELNKKIIGQEKAIKNVTDAIIRSKAKINDPNQPIGSFLFLGPTGVGKTELAKELALNLFGSKKKLLRFDMSEFMDKESITKLIGSPPGYVGYGEMTALSDAVRNNPYSIVLFDEIEKAHPDVLNLLLQILDDGILTDSKGKEVNFKNVIVIMTTNLGSTMILDGDYSDSKINRELQTIFKPEFINRINDIIPFRTLEENDINKIIELELDKLKQRVFEEHSIELNFNKNIILYVYNKGFNRSYGARPIKRIISKEIETLIAGKILTKELKHNNNYNIDIIKNELKINELLLN
ncbi:MAG: ATP-dependent Clp protease ATP-binding subunit [Metamycoplasmataceae bacterium]